MRTTPEKIVTENIAGHSVHFDGSGYLVDPDEWTEDVARFLAQKEDVTLSDEHWKIIAFMRQYLEDHGISADARFTFRYLAELDGLSEKQARARFFELFPYGYVKQACKIAGMKQPRAWSTG